MKRYILLFSTLLSVFSALAQDKKAAMEQFASSIQVRDLEAHLSFLADDALEGRETGQRGLAIAGKYLEAHYKRLGLAPGNKENGTYFQEYKVVNTKLGNATLKVGKESFAYKTDFFSFDLGLMPDKLSPNWVCAGYGLQENGYDNLSGKDLKNKNVIVLAGAPDNRDAGKSGRLLLRSWLGRLNTLQQSGAQSIWMILPDSLYNMINVYGRKSSTTVLGMEETGVPIFITNEKVGTAFLKTAKTSPAQLKTAISAKGEVPNLNFAKLLPVYDMDKKTETLPAWNVMGYLEGTDKKDELVVITAHYDHLGIVDGKIHNGADDDGSGTSAVMELAEAFSLAAKEGFRPRRSILFMNVSGEEKGLLGSDYYTMHPIYPLEKTVTDLNIDMIGRIDPKYEVREDSANYVYIIGADKLSSELHAINEGMNKDYSHLTFDYTYNDEADPNQFYYRSDHYNFAKHGIPVIFYFTGTHKDYHKPTDDVALINFPKMVTISRQVFFTAWEIANREQKLVVDKK